MDRLEAKCYDREDCDVKFALKSELEEVKTKIDNTSNSLNTYIHAQQDLAFLVGEHVASIVTINSQKSYLERERMQH